MHLIEQIQCSTIFFKDLSEFQRYEYFNEKKMNIYKM